MTFEFATATRIVFGEGKRSELFAAAKSFGTRGLLVTGANPGRAAWVREGLRKVGAEVETFTFPTEPTLSRVEEGRRIARASDTQFVIGVGGGSAIDGGKAIAALATNEGEIGYYLEIIGGAKPLTKAPLPFLAVPTTAGTGAEPGNMIEDDTLPDIRSTDDGDDQISIVGQLWKKLACQ